MSPLKASPKKLLFASATSQRRDQNLTKIRIRFCGAQFGTLRNTKISGTWNSCGGKSNLYSTSLNPFTGERERERERERDRKREGRKKSADGRTDGRTEGRWTESDGKINRVAGKT